MTLDEFFAEAKRLNLTAADLVPGLTMRPEFEDCLSDDFKEEKAAILAMPESDLRQFAIAQLIQLRFHEKHGNAMANAYAALRAEQSGAAGVKACQKCRGEGCTDEGDPEVGSALFTCERCGGSGKEPERPGYTDEEVAALNADEQRTGPHGVRVDGEVQVQPSDEELNDLAMRCCGVLHGDVLHMDRRQRIAFARSVLALGVGPSDKVQLPEKARAGIEVLHLVVESLLTTSRYVDEEGEATMALADLSACIADPPFTVAAGVGTSDQPQQEVPRG